MKIILIVVGVLALIVIGFAIYRYVAFKKESAENHKLKHDRVKNLYEKLEKGEEISKEEVLKYATDTKTREQAYHLLSDYKKTDLFPAEFLSFESAAESNLVNWLEFPTELDKAPDDIKHLKRVTIKFDGKDIYYHVFKYMTNEPHWAADNGWMLGVVGPYFDDSKPYDFPNATFSRCSSKLVEIKPEDEVQWVHENIALKKNEIPTYENTNR